VARGETLLALIGVAATGEIETVGVAKDVLVSGVDASSAVGSVVNSSSAGLESVSAQGLVSQAIVPLNSQAIAAEVGTVGAQVSIALTGVGARGNAGAVALGTRNIALVGVAASGAVGNVIALYWKPVDDNATVNWQNVNNTQGSVWSEVDNTQTPSWTLITT
jgi:hypothetical protein